MNTFTHSVLANRAAFNAYLRSVITIKSFDKCDKIVLTFPHTLKKSERYTIHLMSIKGHFEAISHDDDDDNRVLELHLSKKYVQDIFEGYSFPKSEKQILFDSLIDFIEKNLANEFKAFLNTI